jgi:hypothetical protein
MTSTARRRWSRELTTEIDGIACGAEGPVLIHGYDRPPGGKWLDHVIPGKLGALDRNSGETLWMAPCEVGYGRGFGAGFGALGQAVVLGPSVAGHRMVRMSLDNGELLEAADIPPFDEAHVANDMCMCVAAQRVFGIDSLTLGEAWDYAREGERYHSVIRAGDRALVLYTDQQTGHQGILSLNAETGDFDGIVLSPSLPIVHGLATTAGALLILTSDLERVLPPEHIGPFTSSIATHEDGGARDTLSLLALRVDSQPGDDPLWYRILETRKIDDLPEVSISADSGKLYLERSAFLHAADAVTGRALGEWTVPGLDEQIGWSVVQGAGLLAEETRVSMFELPA